MIQDTSSQDVMVEQPGGRKRRLIWIVGGVFAMSALALAYPSIKRWSSADFSVDATRLNIAEVNRGDLVRTLGVEGQIVASSYPTLFAPARGKVTLQVRAGAVVEANQILAVIDSPELQSQLLQETSRVQALESEFERRKIAARSAALRNQQNADLAKLRMISAERALKRAKTTSDEGLMSIADLEAAEDDLSESKLAYEHAVQEAELDKENNDFEIRNQAAQVETGRLVLKEINRRVEALTLRSPVAGVIGTLHVDPRDLVQENQQLLTVIDLSAFEIEIRIPEAYADDVRPGVEAEITFEGSKLEGLVTAVSPEVNNAMVSGTVVFRDNAPDNLKQNQRVSASIRLESKADVLKVRRGPFLERGGGVYAYLIKDGMAVRTPIRTGSTSLTEVEIQSGLNAGDRIVISDPNIMGDAETILLRK